MKIEIAPHGSRPPARPRPGTAGARATVQVTPHGERPPPAPAP